MKRILLWAMFVALAVFVGLAIVYAQSPIGYKPYRVGIITGNYEAEVWKMNDQGCEIYIVVSHPYGTGSAITTGRGCK